MGQDFCKSCVNNDESKKEGNLSNFPKISTNPQITTLQIPSSQLSNTQYNNGTEITTTWKFKEFQR